MNWISKILTGLASIGSIIKLIQNWMDSNKQKKQQKQLEDQKRKVEQTDEQIKKETDDGSVDDLNNRWGWDK